MRVERVELTIRRIVVGLDASEHSREALEAAAQLAASLEAELEGMFVEDVNLLRLVDLSFVREVRSSPAREEAFTTQRMERELRALASQAERTLASVAEQLRLNWSFRVVRGRVEAELLAAALEADLLILGRTSSMLRSRFGIGSTAREIARRCQRSVMLMQQGQSIKQPVCVLYGASATGRKALATAAHLTTLQGEELTVLIPAADEESAAELERQARFWLSEHGQRAYLRRIPAGGIRGLARAVEASGSGVLVVEAECDLLEGDALSQLLEKLACPVLLVR